MMISQLLSEIDAFLLETKMKEYRFGMNAVRNGRLVERLRAGRTPKNSKPVLIRPETEVAVLQYIAAYRALNKKDEAA